jgi:hypothetical protein
MIIKTARLDYPAPVRSPHQAPLHAGHHTTITTTTTTHQHITGPYVFITSPTASSQHDTTQFHSLYLFIYIYSKVSACKIDHCAEQMKSGAAWCFQAD